ncbi:hypothetical protein CR513_16132, partial [Mucuna pruriens]
VMPRLKMNFYKRQLVGIDVDECWMKATTFLLNSKVGTFPFVYLGLPIGTDLRKKITYFLGKMRGIGKVSIALAFIFFSSSIYVSKDIIIILESLPKSFL